jgi:DNA-binding XRE family transcriptional regulator
MPASYGILWHAKREKFTMICPIPEQIFNQHTFAKACATDIQRSIAFIFFDIQFISIDGLSRFANEIKSAVNRGVLICAFVQPPPNWSRRNDPSLAADKQTLLQKYVAALAQLEALGVHISMRAGRHTKIAVFDYRIVWAGSLNMFSYTEMTDEETYRWEDEDWAKATVKRRGFDRCDVCMQISNKTNMKLSTELEPEHIADEIWRLRTAAGLSQKELGKMAGVTRGYIAHVESGQKIPSADVLIKIYKALDRPIHSVSPKAIPLLERWQEI